MALPFSQGRLAWVLVVLFAAGCTEPALCKLPGPVGETAYLVSRGWHVEVGLPAESLTGPLAFYREVFPQARAVMFGYGKKTFFTAPAESVSEYLLGPIPGPAAIQVTGLSVLPDVAYPQEAVLRMPLAPGGGRALADFIWDDIAADRAGAPRLLGPGPFPGSQFYAARSGYSLAHTCNTWVADALESAGAPISGTAVVFSGQVVSRAAEAGACRPAPP